MIHSCITRASLGVAVFGLVAMESLADNFPNQVKWSSAVADGYIDDVANWTGATTLPADGDTQTFDMNNWTRDLVVRVGPGTNVVQQAHFYVVNIPTGRSFTFDTTGGSYLQAAAHYASNWQGFGFYSTGNTHWCNFESLNTSAGAPICSLEDARLVARVDAAGKRTIELEKGTWNCYDPIPNGTRAQNSFMYGNNGDDNTAIFGAGSFLKANAVIMRGGVMKFTGGTHQAYGSFQLGNAYAYNPKLEITGGTLDALGDFKVGDYQNQKSATADISGTGHLSVTNGCLYIISAPQSRNTSMIVRDEGSVEANTVYAGCHPAPNGGTLTLTNNAQMTVKGQLYVSYTANSTGRVEVTDHATLLTKGNVYVSQNSAGAYATLAFSGNAVWQPQAQASVGGAADGRFGLLELGGASRLEVAEDKSITLNAYPNGEILVKEDAVIDAPLLQFTTQGKGGYIEFAGGNTRFGRINVSGSADAGGTVTNIVRVTGGTHTTVMNDSGGYVPLTVGSGNAVSLFEMTGGTLSMPRIARVGYGTPAGGTTPVLRMLGGTFNITPEYGTSGSAVMNICDSKNSTGRIELLGGVLSCAALRGWTGATCRNGGGWAALHADGGTLAANGISSTLVETLDEATLGEKGLTIDTSVKACTVNQAFADAAANVTGRVVKVGVNTLTVTSNSTHGETVVAGGTLAPASAACTQFGRSLVVTNSAIFSLSGTPAAFTVERLTLGDDTTRGILDLDSGDVITITGADGLKVGRGFVRCPDAMTAEGFLNVFRLADGASVSSEELAKLRLVNGSAEYHYSFETADDGEGGQVIRLKTEAWSTTSSTWQGSESGAWTTAANWSTGALPDEMTVATFPAGAATKAISVSGDAAAHQLVLDAGYAFTGSGPLHADVLTANAAASTLAVPLSPYNQATVDVAENASLTLSGGVDSNGGCQSMTKTGSGVLDLTTSSPEWAGDWTLNGGITRLSADAALGPAVADGVLSLGAGTLDFAFGTPDISRTFTFAPGAATAYVLKTDVPTVLRGSFEATNGGAVKRGAASLTLMGTGATHVLALDDMGTGTNIDPVSDIVLPENGNSPEKTGLAGWSILEGKVRLEGTGASATTFQQKQFTLLGGRYSAAANAELEVANCTFEEGGSGRHLLVGGTTPLTTASLAPTLRVVENGVVKCDTLRVGNKGRVSGCALNATPTLAVTNGSVSAGYAVKCGISGDYHVSATMRIGTNGVVQANSTSSGGIFMEGLCDFEIADGGVFAAASPKVTGWMLNNSATGLVRVVRGGRIRVSKITSSTWADGRIFTFLFDGGVLELTAADGASAVYRPDTRPVRLEGDGAEFVVAAGKRHAFHLPISGAAPFVKSGAGELVFKPALRLTQEAGVTEDAGYAPAAWTGLTTVKEGTLTLEAGGATNVLAVKVAEGATLKIAGSQTLGAISGTGTVTGTNAVETLTCNLSVPWNETETAAPTFANITLGAAKVDFNVPADDCYKVGTKKVVAHLGADASIANLRAWRAVNAGPQYMADFAIVGSEVVATLRPCGFVLIFK